MPPALLTFHIHIQDGLRIHVPGCLPCNVTACQSMFPSQSWTRGLPPELLCRRHRISSCPPELFTAARPVTGHQKDLASNAAHQEPWLACGTPMWPLQKSQLGL